MLWANAERAAKVDDFDGALALYARIAENYRRNPLSNEALARIAEISRDRGDSDAEIAAYEDLLSRLRASGKKSRRELSGIYECAQGRRERSRP